MGKFVFLAFAVLWKLRWALLVLVTLAGGFFGAKYFFPQGLVISLTPNIQKTASMVSPTMVVVQVAQPQPWVINVRLSGRVESPSPVLIRSPIGGKLTNISMHIGQKIEAGQVVAAITPVITAQSRKPTKTLVRAADSGYVTMLPISEGSFVGQQEVLAHIQPPLQADLVGLVPHRVQQQLVQGATAMATFSNGQQVQAFLKYVSPLSTREKGVRTGQYRVQVLLTPVPVVPSGMVTSLALPVGLTQAVHVPTHSLVASQTMVFVVQEGSRVAPWPVQVLGPAGSSHTWVQGIPANMPVVVAATQPITSGSVVTIEK